MRLIEDPIGDKSHDTSWSFRTARVAEGTALVLCASMLAKLSPEGAKAGRAAGHLMAPHKPAGDLLVNADACTRGAAPVRGVRVAVELDDYRKELAVFGDRAWRASLGGAAASEPQPFTRMPISYERAFGGPGYAANPTGIGHGSGARGHRVPNIVRLTDPSPSPGGNSEPAGFAAIPPSWQPRAGKLGTFDERWLAQRWPAMPADFDPGYWNEAPADQQFPGYFRGDERLAFENMHPAYPKVEMQLPARRARAFAAMADGEFRELPLVLDTVAVDLVGEQAELVWRGNMPVRSPRLREIAFLFASIERLSTPFDAPTWRARFEAARRAQHPTFEERVEDHRRRVTEQEAGRAARLAEARSLLAAARSLFGDARTTGGPSLRTARQRLEGHDVEALLNAAIETMRRRDLGRADAFEARLREADAWLGGRLERHASLRWTRERVIGTHREGGDMAEADLSGLDLGGLDLTGAKLARANLIGSRLVATKLHGADLTEANLRSADASGADFTRATLTGAHFGNAALEDTRFVEAGLHDARFAGAKAARLCAERARAAGADFSHADLAGALFAGADLSQAKFAAAHIVAATFDGAVLNAADFSGAQGEDASFKDGDLTNLRGIAADLAHARFSGCKAPLAVWQQAKLDRADFSRAVLSRGNFAEASLRGAGFDRAHLDDATMDDADLQHAVLTHANLLRVSFERADLKEADLRGANLYRAGLAESSTIGTRFDGAFMAGTRLRQ
jgi:uncharacterized protein YjbI with pentapeptide repeats